MNHQSLIALSSELDQVIRLSRDEDEDDQKPWSGGPLKTAATLGVGAGGLMGHQAIKSAGGYAAVGRKTAAGASAAKTAASRIYNPSGAPTGLGNFLNKGNLSRIGRSAKSAFTHTMSARHEKLVNLSAELDSVINLDWMGAASGIAKKLWTPSVGAAALKWGGLGAAGGALAGGVSGAMSDDPNKTAIGGAMSGAVTGGAIGALGGAGMRGQKIYGRMAANADRGIGKAAVAGMTPKVAAPTATAAADQMAATGASGRTYGPSTPFVDEGPLSDARFGPTKKVPLGYSSRLQSLVQLNAELDSVLTT